MKWVLVVRRPGSSLDEGEESLFEDVEHSGQEERQRQEDEQLVSELTAVVLEDELPAQVDVSRHAPELLIGLLHRLGGGDCRERSGGEIRKAWNCTRKEKVLILFNNSVLLLYGAFFCLAFCVKGEKTGVL